MCAGSSVAPPAAASLLSTFLSSSPEAPKVEVYSRKHGAIGEENVLNCFVNGFHPPQISITLLKNGEPMSDVKYMDMSFNDKWYFQQLVYAPFTPQRGDVYSCRVVHSALPEPQTYRWGMSIVCRLRALLMLGCRSQDWLAVWLWCLCSPFLGNRVTRMGWILKVL